MDINYKLPWQQLVRHLIDDLVQSPGMTLPGMSVIGRRYNATRRAVEHALGHLEELGVIAPARQGQKRRINLAKLQRIAALQGRTGNNRIFFISNSSPANLPFMARDIHEAFHMHCERDGFALDYIESPPSAEELHTLLATLQPRGVILYTVPAGVADVVSSLGIPAVGIGTACSRMPVFNSDYPSLLVQAFRQARSAGHRRIAAPTWAAVGDDMYERLAGALEKRFSGPPVSFSRRYNLPLVQGETMPAFHAALRELFRYTPPTCIILGGINEYLTTSSFFLKEGLCIPDDVSVILLSHDPLLDHNVSSIARFVLYSDDMMMQAFRLLQEQMNGLRSNEQIELVPVWAAGDSLASPRAR